MPLALLLLSSRSPDRVARLAQSHQVGIIELQVWIVSQLLDVVDLVCWRHLVSLLTVNAQWMLSEIGQSKGPPSSVVLPTMLFVGLILPLCFALPVLLAIPVVNEDSATKVVAEPFCCIVHRVSTRLLIAALPTMWL
jgi:hypothetical protein